MKRNKLSAYTISGFIFSIIFLSLFMVSTPYPVFAKTTVKTSLHKKTIPKKISKSSYSLSDVSIHNSSTSCWTTINGNVYNLTSWINKHPGGRHAILSLCGKDGTQDFNNQHGGQARPAEELRSFLVGTLK